VDEGTGQELFVHESKVPAEMRLQTGDKVRFQASVDSSGRASAVVLAPDPSKPAGVEAPYGRSLSVSTPASVDASPAGRVPFASVSPSGGIQINSKTVGGSTVKSSANEASMPCFSMSQPFAALLLNGYKTVESRNIPMFIEWEPGTQILLHCGQRDWPDVESYKSLLPTTQPPSSQVPIDQAAQLRNGFSKGSVIGVVTIGKTWCSTDAEKVGSGLQKRVLAPSNGIGRYCTEIVHASWLKRPHKMRGSTGVYNISIPRGCLPQ
jgi:cold shock CspA family protein